jgi:group II intron reverse transcriptase/maturase
MSVLSNDGPTWSTKLQRIGELSANDKTMMFNNIGHIISLEWLCELYRELDGSKATGIDGITKEMYGKNLDDNLKELICRIRRGTYRPKPSRLVEIPKEDGSTRPLAISCVEDKLVQMAASKVLSAIYEPLFLPCSYGFRPNKSCHDALKELSQMAYKAYDGAVVEIDLRKYFNSIPHGPLFDFLGKKISDTRFLHLLQVLTQTPTLTKEGAIIKNEEGCPQGSIISPILSNVYLHHVIDEWFAAVSKTHLKGWTAEIRYADDMVFVFQYASQASRFYKVLNKRLGKFGIEMHAEKSQILPSGTKAAERVAASGKRMKTYKFLGFTCYWGIAVNGKFWRLKFKSRSDRKRAKLKSLRKFLRENLNTPNALELMKKVTQVVRGWVNYHAVSDNYRAVKSFLEITKQIIFKWFRRRGSKRGISWKRLTALLELAKFPRTFRVTPMIPTPKPASR